VCHNTGQARWLSSPLDGTDVGVVKVGIMRCDADGAVVERDWIRVPLPRDVDPGESVEIACEVPVTSSVCVDLVSEHVKWFGAATAPIAARVSP
jgi:hypothetical protein